MAQLLPEILRTIFILVREEQGLSALTRFSTVSKLWQEVADPVLWSHVVLNNDTLQSFSKNHKSASDKLKTVRSVTLHIQVVAFTYSPSETDRIEPLRLHGCPQTQILQQDIDQFSTFVLPRLEFLDSFSLFVHSHKEELPEAENNLFVSWLGFRLQTEVLGRLLKSLPASCSSLELDTSGTDWSPEQESHHLCSDIWYILPRLRHVKLRIHNLCSRILLRDPSDPNGRRNEPKIEDLEPRDTGNLVQADRLATLSICLMGRVNAGCQFCTCPDLQSGLDNGRRQPWPLGGGGPWVINPLQLTSNIVSAYKLGCFPAASKLEVTQQKRTFSLGMPGYEEDFERMDEQELQRAELYASPILLRDCIEDKTYPMPKVFITPGMHGLYDKSDNCVIGSYGDVCRHAENTVWGETVYGARMPFGVKMAHAGATPGPPPQLLTRKEWRQRSKKGMLSWRKEEGRTGVKIRRVIPLDGVDVNFDYPLMPLLPARGERVPGDNRPL